VSLANLSQEDQLARQEQIRAWAVKQGLAGAPPPAGAWGDLYAPVLELLPGELDRQEFILECVKEGDSRLNTAHLLIAQLMVNRRVSTVLTTNFDDLLVRALQLYLEVPAILDGSGTSQLKTSSPFLQVAHLHGKLNSYRQRHTAAEVNEAVAGFDVFLRQAIEDFGLVVIGYRGGNEAPMRALYEALEARGAGPARGLYWASYENSFDDLSDGAKRLLALKDTYWIRGADADRFLESLCASPALGLGLPRFIEDLGRFYQRVRSILPQEVRERQERLQRLAKPPMVERPSGEDGRWEEGASLPVAIPSEAVQLLSAATDRWKSGDLKGALEVCLEALAKNPGDAAVHSRLGTVLDGLGRPEEALKAFKKAVELDPESAVAQSNLAKCLQGLSRFSEAEAAARRAVKLDPEFGRAWNNWGNALLSLGRAAEAVEKLREAVSKDPKDPMVHNNLGNALQADGRPEGALEEYRLAVDLKPDYVMALVNWGAALQDLGRLDATQKYEEALSLDPRHVGALYNLGIALQQRGLKKEACDKYRLAAEVSEEPWILTNWGNALQDLGLYEEAIEKYRRATEIDSNHALPWHNWGNALVELERFEDAVECYERATQVEPSYAPAWEAWGVTLFRLNRDADAREKLREAERRRRRFW